MINMSPFGIGIHGGNMIFLVHCFQQWLQLLPVDFVQCFFFCFCEERWVVVDVVGFF